MIGQHLSVILLPTNKCNVACEYCFEDKTDDFMSHERLGIVIDKLLDHMVQKQIGSMTIYWQGGEVMILPPAWFERANDLIAAKALAKGKHIGHSLQSNMIGYSPKWNGVIRGMFGNSVGTSMDYPNLYRKAKNRTPEEYTAMWTRNVRQAIDAGIEIGVISIPNRATIEEGAERFYSYFVDKLGITDFQVNTSFSGGEESEAKRESILDLDGLSGFFSDLVHVWVERGYAAGVRLGPIDELMKHFSGDAASLPCIWQQNCADEFVSIDARGYVAQCDCWVTSYPDYWFGNIFDDLSFTELLKRSAARQKFQARPEKLIQISSRDSQSSLDESCLGCDYLSICHGGCPVRTYSITGEFFVKDPYCQVYKTVFSTVENMATRVAAGKSSGILPVLQAQ